MAATYFEGASHRIGAAVAALTRWINRAEDEFGALDPREVSAIALDLGLSEHDLRAVAAQGPQAARQLVERMKALHLDPVAVDKAHPDVMHDLQRLCSLCTAKGRCQRDLAVRPDDPAWETYCPNVMTLHALAREA